MSVRSAAARVLQSVDRRRETLAAGVDRERAAFEDRRDRGLLVELTAGALRWRNELDAVIAAASGRSTAKIDPAALSVLRVAVYEIRHLRTPPHAAVHDAVETMKTIGAPRAGGFVNAVLRAVLRRGPAIALPPRPTPGASLRSELAYLTTTCSHPGWLVARWRERYGFEHAERWCQFNNTSPAITIRSLGRLPPAALLDRLHEAGIDGRPARFVDDALELPAGALGRTPQELRDEFWVQDEGSQLIARFAGAEPGERVLDVCAAPGGKTLVMAADMRVGEPGVRSEIIAGDRRPHRIELLSATTRLGRLRIPVVALDATAPLPFGPIFDCVLLDAPCSGLGALRRDPDLKWSRTDADLSVMADAQSAMLVNAADLVRPGGRLVYSTCSSEPEENDAVVRRFLSHDDRFVLRPMTSSSRVPAAVLDADGLLRTNPFDHDLDGFFAALLVRRAGA